MRTLAEAEEIDELRAADNAQQREAEFGDLLFALVNFARWIDVDPEVALRNTNRKFKTRFALLERTANERGLELREMGLEEMEAIWNASKKGGQA